MTMVPTATTVAGEEPDTAAKSMHASTEAMASPPCRWPDARVREADHAARDPARRHERSRQDEERDRQSVNCSEVS